MTTSINIRKGKATTNRTTFSRETEVSVEIKSEAAIVWKLLSTASDYSRWNSTITSLEGKIARGETIRLKSHLDAKRTFVLSVKEFEPEKRLVWGDGQGNRVYTIENTGNKTVLFTMKEKIGGLMFPLYAKMIPPFDESFDRFANDLKIEAEKIMNAE